ncbi:MAG: O-antigen ligase family protein, partial [Candidatus Aminicenantes bacterium]|nr:O-antigen ligase family protein [Candidatus Aminicenantes bacterium]
MSTRVAIDPPMGIRDQICRKIIDYGILGLIVFSPLPAASVYEWSILVIQLAVLVMLGAYILLTEKPQNNELLTNSLKWSKVLFIGFFVFLVVQISPLPKLLVKMISPSSYAFQERFLPDFANLKFASFSLIPAHTLREGLEILCYFLLGLLVVKTVTKWRQIIRIYYALIGIGVFQALYGLFELYNKNPRILFYEKMYHLDSVTGTFVNRNHFSGYMEMVIPLALGLAIARIDLLSLMELRWRDRLLRLSERRLSTSLLISLGIIVMAIAVIFSKSRSGLFLLVFSFILFFGLTIMFFRRTEHQKKGTKNFIAVVFIIIIFISLYIGIDATIERFALDKLLREGRPTYWANTAEIFADYPLLGTGLGTFPSLYPDIEGEETLIRLYHAHNDYLEYLSELGIVGMWLLLGGILYLLIKSFLVLKERRHPEVKGLGLGGIVAIICILIHSL